MAKKILILSVVCGGGHFSAARSVSARIKELEPDAEIEVVDILKTYSLSDFYITKYGYAAMIGHIPWFYAMGYWLSNHGLFKNFYAAAPLRVARNIAPKLYQRINETKPDVIYCTHFYPAMALSLLRQAYKVPPVVIASSLDYAVEPFFDKVRNIDFLTIANEEFIPGRLHSGFTLEQIRVTGVPTSERFYNEPNKIEARNKLGLNPDIFTVLIMFGGGEWAGTYKIYKELVKDYSKEIQIIVINGNNQKTFNKIEKCEKPDNVHLLNVGFTSEVEVYMAASDIALTKAGGLSTTEMVNSELPMLISTKVYGQEKRNMEFMVSHGVALSFKNTKDLHEKIDIAMTITDLFKSKFPLIKKHGADNIASLILEQPIPEYDDEYIASLDYKKMKKHMKILLDELIHITSKKIM